MERVLFIGLDGMDPQVTRSLMADGKLPNFADFEFSELKTGYPPHSPVSWTSIATGCNPAKHNIFDFIGRDPKTYTPELMLFDSHGSVSGTKYSSHVRGTPFWRLSSKKGIATSVIRFPLTFPPEEVNGRLLSGLGVPDIKGFLSSYVFYTTEDEKDKKVVNVVMKGDLVETYVSGPKTRKGNDILDIRAPMHIDISKKVTLHINNKKYEIGEKEWSDWMRVEFKIGAFQSIHGLCRAYLLSLNPFRMYLTTVQIDPDKPLFPISYPQDYSKELAKEMGPYYTLGMPEETDPFVDGRIGAKVFLQQCAHIEEQRDKMFWSEFDKFKGGIYAFVYDTSDRIQHVFWNNRLLEGDRLAISPEIEDYWVKKDAFLGKVVEKISSDTTLLIASDHGFTSFERAVNINRWLVDEGFMKLTKDIKGDEAPLFEHVDWARTEAYSVGFNSIYVNLKGREAQGIVENRDGLVAELASKLEKLKDPKFGKKAVNKAYAREEVYSGPYLENSPDMIIGFNPGYRMAWQSAIGGFTDKVIFENERRWNGDHLVDPCFVSGVLFSNKKISSKKPHQMDIAPTILDIFSIPHETDGKSLF